MAVAHNTITDPNIHEPKGVASAAVNTHYAANGAGSGTWQKIQPNELDGITSDAGLTNHRVGVTGTGDFIILDDADHGSMTITNNAVNAALTAVADTTFNTPAQFTLCTGAGFPWVGENLHGIIFDGTNKLTVPVAGIYLVEAYINVGAFTATGAKICIRYLVNGTSYSSRKPTVKSAVVNDETQLFGFGLVSLAANDYIQLTVATDNTGNMLWRDANVSVFLIRQT